MLTVYIIAAAVGGILVLLSALGGGDGDTAELEGGAPHAEIDTGADADHGEHGGDLGWLSFFGMRFWSYFAAFFGLTGVLLSSLTDVAGGLIAGGAAMLGLFSGAGASTATRLLTRSQSSSGVASADLLGAEGVVLVTVRKDVPGKVRCSVRGDVLDLHALTTDDSPIPVGREVLVVGSEGHRVTVVPRETLLLSSTADESQRRGG